jgi:hypothetical protein
MSFVFLGSTSRRPFFTRLWLSLLLLGQCQTKDVAALPPASSSGANTVGCLVDGQVLVPRDGHGKSGLTLGFRLSTTAAEATLSVSLHDVTDTSKPLVEISADSIVLAEGQPYPFSVSAHRGVVTGTCFTNAGGTYLTSGPASGTLTITRLDRAAKLLAGRFEFVGTDRTTGKQVRVTQGRFDFQSQ